MSDTEIDDGEPQYSVVFSDDPTSTKHGFLSRDGTATARYANGDSYSGSYVNNKRHGSGTYTFRNGASYTGQWSEGLKHGEGTMTYPDRGSYTGSWQQGRRHGYGVYRYKSGDRYSGEWQADKKHGKGVYVFERSGEQVKGEWSNGQLMSGGWEQRGWRYIGSFRKQQPHGHALVVNAHGHTAAGHYSDTNTFVPLTFTTPHTRTSSPSATSAAAPSTPPIVTKPPPLTVATRALENTILSLSHSEGIYRLLRAITGAPNYRRVGETALFLTGQPTAEGVKAVVAAVQEAGFGKVVWLDARDEVVVYVGDNGFIPRHPKRPTSALPLPTLSLLDADTLESSYAYRVQQRIAHRGGLLPHIKETYAELPIDRRYLQSQSDVPAATPVRSTRQLFIALAEEDDLSVEYQRVRVAPEDVDGVCEAIRGWLGQDGAALVVSDWMGKEAATWVGVLALVMQRAQDGAGDEEEVEAAEATEEKVQDEEKEEAEAEEEEKEADDGDDKDDDEQDEQQPDGTKDEQTDEQPDQQPQDEKTQDSKTDPDTAPSAPPAEPAATEPAVQPADVAAAPVVPAPVVLSAEERAAAMREGRYGVVMRLVALLGRDGVSAKAAVDSVAESAGGMVNVRECVRWAFEQWEGEGEERGGDRGREWLRLGRQWVERYCYLILLAAWLKHDAASRKAAEAAAEEEAAEDAESKPPATFASWLSSKAELTAALSEEIDAFVWNV